MTTHTRIQQTLHDHTLDLLCRQWTTHDRQRLASARKLRTLHHPSTRHNTIWQSIQMALNTDRANTPFAA